MEKRIFVVDQRCIQNSFFVFLFVFEVDLVFFVHIVVVELSYFDLKILIQIHVRQLMCEMLFYLNPLNTSHLSRFGIGCTQHYLVSD